jgi:hypothetical protein
VRSLPLVLLPAPLALLAQAQALVQERASAYSPPLGFS